MAGGKYNGVLRSRSKTNAAAASFNVDSIHQSSVTGDIMLKSANDLDVKPLIDRLLAEIDGRKFTEIHCINLESLFESRVLSLVGEACRDNGIFYVTDHGLPSHLLEDLRRLASVFFSLSSDEKSRCCTSNALPGKKKFQYTEEVDGETLQINCGPSLLYRIDWPTEPALLSKVLAEYLVQHRGLCAKLLKLVSRSLGLGEYGLLSTCFEPFTQMIIRSYSPAPNSIWPTTVDEGTYSSVLTMTLPDHTGGLQIFTDGRWYDVKPCPGAILISAGDQLRILSDGKYKSCMHRVVAGKCARRMFIDVSFCASKDFITDLELAPSQIMSA